MTSFTFFSVCIVCLASFVDGILIGYLVRFMEVMKQRGGQSFKIKTELPKKRIQIFLCGVNFGLVIAVLALWLGFWIGTRFF